MLHMKCTLSNALVQMWLIVLLLSVLVYIVLFTGNCRVLLEHNFYIWTEDLDVVMKRFDCTTDSAADTHAAEICCLSLKQSSCHVCSTRVRSLFLVPSDCLQDYAKTIWLISPKLF